MMRIKPCEFCGYYPHACQCPGCPKCGKTSRKRCLSEHKHENIYVAIGPADVCEFWLARLNAEFLLDSGLKRPTVTIGREGVAFTSGGGVVFGVMMPFPLTRHEVARAIERHKAVALGLEEAAD